MSQSWDEVNNEENRGEVSKTLGLAVGEFSPGAYPTCRPSRPGSPKSLGFKVSLQAS